MESLFPGQPRMGNTKSAAISAFAAELYVGGSGSGSGSGSGGGCRLSGLDGVCEAP